MDENIKYILFNPSNSLYDRAFKFHKFKESLFISLKSIEESIGYTEKLFPGDDRDQIIIKTKKELYFKIGDKFMENRLRAVIETTKKIIFAYKLTNEINTNALIEFHFYEDIKQNSELNYIEFPFKIETNSSNSELYNDEEINWDELW
jgi:hypothetical protein